MLAAGPKVSWQQYAPGPAPSSTLPRQVQGAQDDISAEL